MKKTLFFLGFLGLCLGGYRFSLYINDILVPSDVENTWVNLVEETKVIKVPGMWGHLLNPGIVPYKDGYLMSFRTGSDSLIGWVKRHLKMEKHTFICFIKLDSEFRPVGRPSVIRRTSLLEPINLSMGEDPRLITFNNKVYALYNDHEIGDIEFPYFKRMHIAEVKEHDGKFTLENIRILSFPDAKKYYEAGLVEKQFEKNWSPFVHKDELYLVYMPEPHVVVKPDLTTGICTLVAENENIDLCPRGIARCGTPASLLKDDYVAFFHTRLIGGHRFPKLHKTAHPSSSVYCFSAYAFGSEPPFQITKKMEGYITGKGLFNTRQKTVYPTGYIVKDDYIYLFLGINNEKMAVSKIPKDPFLALLKPIIPDSLGS